MTNLFYIINDHGGISLEEFTFIIGTMATVVNVPNVDGILSVLSMKI